MADRARFCSRFALFVTAIALGECRDDRGDFRDRDDSLACSDSLARSGFRGDADFHAGDDSPACGERFEWVVGGSPVQNV